MNAPVVTERCPKCSFTMCNWPNVVTRCQHCNHEWMMGAQPAADETPAPHAPQLVCTEGHAIEPCALAYVEEMQRENARLRSSGETTYVLYAWTIPGDENADMNGFIPARMDREGEFTKPLYALRAATSLEASAGEMTTERPPPEGYSSWYDAAVSERVRRIKAESLIRSIAQNLDCSSATCGLACKEYLSALKTSGVPT